MNVALIAGHGGSGTNWLLDILDQSSATFCANERNRVAYSVMSELPDPSIDCGQYAGLEDVWEWVVRETKHRFGERDPVSRSKFYLYPGLRGQLLYLIRRRQRLRALISIFSRRLSGPEWPAPPFLVRQDKLDEALLVLKIIRCPALACWLLENRADESVVIHILRHPGGALNSWRRRFLDQMNERIVGINNRIRLKAIIESGKNSTPNTRKKIIDHLNDDANDLFRSELLYWLYLNERIYECGNNRSNYKLINYDVLAREPEITVRGIYSLLGLSMDSGVMERISKKVKNSFEISNKWKDSFSSGQRVMIERVLEGSLLEAMWG